MRNLVILGGGYGGLKILLTLLNHSLPDDIQITLIDKNPYHSMKTEFYTIAAGTTADQEVRMEFPADDNVDYVFAKVKHIDTAKQEIIVNRKTNDIIPYDYLVVALGCEDNYHGI